MHGIVRLHAYYYRRPNDGTVNSMRSLPVFNTKIKRIPRPILRMRTRTRIMARTIITMMMPRRRSRTRRRRRLAKYVLADFVFILHAYLSLFSALSLFLPIFIRSLFFSFFSIVSICSISISYALSISLSATPYYRLATSIGPSDRCGLTDWCDTNFIYGYTRLRCRLGNRRSITDASQNQNLVRCVLYQDTVPRLWCTVFLPDTASTIVISVPFFFFSFGFLHLLLLFPSPFIISQQ